MAAIAVKRRSEIAELDGGGGGGGAQSRMLETKGVSVASESAALDRDELRELFEKRERVRTAEIEGHIAPPCVIVCCDPNGGGASHLAVAAIYREPWSKRIVILGADSDRIKRDYTVTARCEFVACFLRRIRTLRQLDTATIVFCVERNTGQEVGTFYDYIDRLSPEFGLVHLYRDSDREVGLWTDAAKKRLYLHAIRTFLGYSSIALSADWVARDAERTRPELYEQLARVRELTIQGKSAMSADRWTWSGKLNADHTRSDRFQDDMAMSLMQCFYLYDNILAGLSPIPAPITGKAQRPARAKATQDIKRARAAAV